jgi:perosamine synthetase
MTRFHIEQFVNTLKNCLPPDRASFGLHEPTIGTIEREYVLDCLDSTYVSSVGKYVDEFERRLAEYTGVSHAVAVVNGTAALHVCLLLAGVKPNDEVLLPALTFIATANAISYLGAVPHFVDSEMTTLGMDPSKLTDYLHDITEIRNGECYNKTTGRRIKAVVPMHTFGHPVDLDPLAFVCEKYALTLVEDAAESLGSFYKGRHTGHWGKVSALSFNGNKIVTTGGGGAILTNDAQLARRAKHITTTAKVPHRWAYVHDEVGYNYRLPNLNAALGCAQIEQIDRFLDSKRRLAERYYHAFSTVPGVRFFTEPEFARSNYWLNAILLDREYAHYRDELLEKTNDAGVMTRPAWALLHTLPMYADCPRMDLSVAEDIERRLINIPSSAGLV